MKSIHARTIRVLQITQRLRDESPLQLLPRGVSGFDDSAALNQILKDVFTPAVEAALTTRFSLYDIFIKQPK